jgi:hypothetical protein
MEDEFFKISTNTLRIPDGIAYVGLQIENLVSKIQKAGTLKMLSGFAMNSLAKQACSLTELVK